MGKEKEVSADDFWETIPNTEGITVDISAGELNDKTHGLIKFYEAAPPNHGQTMVYLTANELRTLAKQCEKLAELVDKDNKTE